MAASELPEGRYLTCPVDVAVDTGGQTRALLMRNRIFAQQAGISSSILTFGPTQDLDHRRETLLERGLLLPQTELLNVYEAYRDTDWDGAEATGAPLEDLSSFLSSECALPDGSPWRRTYRPPGRRPVHEYLRPDGTAFVRIPSFVFKDAQTWPRILRLSRAGQVVGHFDSPAGWYRHWIRALSRGHERSFVFIDSRFIAPLIAPMKAPNIHLIYLLHNLHLGDERRRWDSPSGEIYDRLLGLVGGFDAFVTLTDRQRQDIAQRCGRTSNLFVVPNPVDMPPEPDEPPVRDPRLVAVVARLEGQKRLSHAIEAFRHVVKEVPDARLEIWGSGSRAEGLQQAIDRRGLQASVTMMGHHPRAREALWRSSAMVMTSLFEGYPLSTLESLSHGCPVVSYDIKYGPREQITDGVDGFLVPPGDTRQLAERLVRLLRDPAMVARMSRAAREKAHAHGYERFVSDWASVLDAAVSLKAKRTRLEEVTLSVDDLRVRGRRLGRLPRSSGAVTVPLSARLLLRGSLDVVGHSRGSDLGEARVELAAVHEATGDVVDVPISVRQQGRRLRLRARVPLADLYPSAPDAEQAPTARLRLRLVWQNSAWDTVLRRPHGPHAGVVELSYTADGELRLLRPS